ncbi:MAG TPA: helix-turn-helix domain-containing protein [Candidatus Atribacteria bacterium]|nr:helix-turn-helix domain-containing protein [Candidatus Atribacteria bacterium]
MVEGQLKLGEILREKREEKKLTYDEVSGATHISSRYIAALEEENWDKLPGRAYALGYLKIYSRFLGLNEEEMVSLFNQVYSVKPVDWKSLDWKKTEEPGLREAKDRRNSRSTLFKRLLAVLISLAVFFAFLFIFFSFNHLPEEGEVVVVNPPVSAIEPEEIFPSPSAEVGPQFSLTVTLLPEKVAWAEIWSGGNEVFSGILVPNKEYVIKSNYPIEVEAKGGNGVKATVNGEDRGYLSEKEEASRQVFEP